MSDDVAGPRIGLEIRLMHNVAAEISFREKKKLKNLESLLLHSPSLSFRFFTIHRTYTMNPALVMRHTSTNRAFIGGAISLTAGLVVGTAGLLGFGDSAAQVLSKCMAVWMNTIAYHRIGFPKLLMESTASHRNGPLDHLRLLNNAPDSLSVLSLSASQPPPTLLFVHSRCA
ncbi:hypothetical protein BJV82DRAFT_374987 [Fennellomyces sp. T-0311]|nr:hypothetical protein BJV82DRAFT_374987 [Fennellomyces sp. T-0311]